MVEIDDRTSGRIGFQILDEPVILLCSRCGLVVLAGRIQVNEMPASRVEAIVMVNIFPIVKVARCIILSAPYMLVFMIANRGVGDRVEAGVMIAACPIPVAE